MSRSFQLPEAAVPCLSVWAKPRLASRLRLPNLEYRSSEVAFEGFSKRELGAGRILGDSLKGGCRSFGTVIVVGGCSNLSAGLCRRPVQHGFTPILVQCRRIPRSPTCTMCRFTKGNDCFHLLLLLLLMFTSYLRVHWSHEVLCTLPAS